LFVYECELEASAGGVAADVCCFYVEPVRAVSVLACVPGMGEPEAVDDAFPTGNGSGVTATTTHRNRATR
jgi:hypothetical protein